MCSKLSFSREDRRLWLIVSLCVFAVSLFVLWWNAAPSVTFHDSGEFAMAAASAGVPHPPGAPTWTMLASAFIRVGHFADPARGTNLFSGFCAAITLALLCGLMQVWVYLLFPSLPRWTPPAAGITAVLVMLHSSAFLEQALTTEQYTLMTALIMGILVVATAITLRRDAARPITGLFAFLGLLWGLAIGNHLSQVSLVFLVLWAVWVGTRKETRLRDFVRLGGVCAAGLITGLLVFLWVPIRAHADPLINWGNVKTLDRFIWAISRKQWPTRPISESPPGFIYEWFATYDPMGQFGIIGFLLVIIGLIVLVKKHKLWLGWLGAVAVPYSAGMLIGHMRQENVSVSYIVSYGVLDWHLPIYLMGAIAAAIGIGFIFYRLYEYRAGRMLWPSALVMISLLAVTAGLAVGRASLRDFSAPQDIVNAVLKTLPSDCILIVCEDDMVFNLPYYAYVSNPGSKYWVISRLKPVYYMMKPGGGWDDAKRIRYLTKPTKMDEEQPIRPPTLSLEKACHGRIFVDFAPRLTEEARYMVPAGLLLEVLGRPTTNEEIREAEQRWRREFPELLRDPKPNSHRLERDAWAVMYQRRGAFFTAREMWPEATDMFARSVRWVPNDTDIWFCLAHALEQSGDFRKAEEAYKTTIELGPYLSAPRSRLAVMYAQAGHYKEAERLLLEALKLDPNYKPARINLSIVRRQMQKQ